MKKQKQPVFFVLCSLASWVVDLGAFRLLLALFGGALGGMTEPVSNVIARIISSFFNFNLNNRLVFQGGESYGKSLLRYYLLAVPILAASTLLLELFLWMFHVESENGATLVKVLVDGALFVASFFIQKYWVFRKKTES